MRIYQSTEIEIVSNEPHKLGEEEGALWLWAFPKLLLWDRPFRWIFSFCGGERRTRVRKSDAVASESLKGDLWGIDDVGDLLVLEGKFFPRQRNPFRQLRCFEHYRRRNSEFSKFLQAESIKQLWSKRLQDERAFTSNQFPLIEQGRRPDCACPGVSPYSSRRFATCRWPTLYRKHILPQFSLGSTYEQETEKYLESFNGCVHYIGLLVLRGGRTPELSAEGHSDFEKLKRRAGGARFVHLRAVSMEPLSPNGTRFSGWR